MKHRPAAQVWTSEVSLFRSKTLFTALLLLALPLQAQSENNPQARLGPLEFSNDYPTAKTASRLYDELDFQRACQVYLWALPAMNMVAMRDGQAAIVGGGNNVLAIWKQRPNSKTLFLTANPDVVYGQAFIDLKDGPVVFEAPPQMQGLLDDFWHRPLTDVGLAGPDQGKGGKYLLLPPDYAGKVPAGYYALKSPTYGVFVFLRAFLDDGKTEAGVQLIEQARIYSLAQKDKPPAMQFPNASAVPSDYVFKHDIHYFEALASFLEHEPVAPEDLAMRGMAASLGIVKGQPFQPDMRMQAILDSAADVAFKMATVESYDSRHPNKLIYPDRKWEPAFLDGSPVFRKDSYLDLDAMISFFHKAFSTSNGMVVKMPGKGAQYLFSPRDADGNYLSGGTSYRLHVPANVPAANFWSVVLYDADTRSLLDNGQPFPSIASNSNLKLNADGSADIWFGPTPPKAANANWIKTVPGRGYFASLRLFGPTQTFFNKEWKPDDIVKVQ
ncbi:DUF1254 domain-containing protein [Pseudomonas jessenii]|uniref:DUF1254 domain-containing protein n=1 Tax=Pseudomonas jessenii TaxID=77298 RepID=UPI003892BD2E